MLMIVGQSSSPEEAKELEFIIKSMLVGKRARCLALKTKNEVKREVTTSF